MKKYGKLLAGIAYGLLPVLLALVLIWSLGALASLVCRALGLEESIVLQISQALQQLQEAKLELPWLAGLVLGLLSSGLLWLVKSRKGLVALCAVGVLLLLPLTLGAFCLVNVNDVQLAMLLRTLLRLL